MLPTINDGIFVTMDFPTFQTILKSFPLKIQYLVTNSMVPPQTSINNASKSLWNVNDDMENKFMKNYNNLIFLETESAKVMKKSTKKFKKGSVPSLIVKNATSLAFSPTGD